MVRLRWNAHAPSDAAESAQFVESRIFARGCRRGSRDAPADRESVERSAAARSTAGVDRSPYGSGARSRSQCAALVDITAVAREPQLGMYRGPQAAGYGSPNSAAGSPR